MNERRMKSKLLVHYLNLAELGDQEAQKIVEGIAEQMNKEKPDDRARQIKVVYPNGESFIYYSYKTVQVRCRIGFRTLKNCLDYGLMDSSRRTYEYVDELRRTQHMEKIIDKLITEIECHLKETEGENASGTFDQGYDQGCEYCVGLLQQLKSSLPKPVEVLPCVDEFLSCGNKAQKLACLVSCKYNILTCDMAEGELKQWLREVSMEDLLSLANGYTVVKEPLYYVMLPELNTDTYNVYGLKKYSDGKINVACYDKGDIGKSINSKFTEQEIKAIDERYWAFAVPVEEEE
jgi:hypothetical protein